MNLEETQKIIQNKIEADEAAREVRSHIKSYIHEKQNLRERFTETFKPLIETSEAVKTSIDTQQNKLIKQLQDNQLALTDGFEGNRKAITSGFDKMDEVKRWDLSQLPGLEASEEPEMEEEEEEEEEEKGEEDETIEKIKEIQNLIIKKNDLSKKLIEESEEKFKDANIEEGKELYNKAKEQLKEVNVLQREIKRLKKFLYKETEEKQEPPKRVISFNDSDLDSGLNTAASVKLLKKTGLPLPSTIKNVNYNVIKSYQKKAEYLLADFQDSLVNKANFGVEGGINRATPNNKNPRTKTLKQISYYNILSEYVNNINKLENIAKKKTGQGIIHFNNPQQLVDRLELLVGSIFAGNNGVKQEFSQIAHLLHQLKVITKKKH